MSEQEQEKSSAGTAAVESTSVEMVRITGNPLELPAIGELVEQLLDGESPLSKKATEAAKAIKKFLGERKKAEQEVDGGGAASQPRLESLQIENFRSVGERLILDLPNDVTLVHGANGTGKSTIVHAVSQLAGSDVRPDTGEKQNVKLQHVCSGEPLTIGAVARDSTGRSTVITEPGVHKLDVVIVSKDRVSSTQSRKAKDFAGVIADLIGLGPVKTGYENLDAAMERRTKRYDGPELTSDGRNLTTVGEYDAKILALSGGKTLDEIHALTQAAKDKIELPNLRLPAASLGELQTTVGELAAGLADVRSKSTEAAELPRFLRAIQGFLDDGGAEGTGGDSCPLCNSKEGVTYERAHELAAIVETHRVALRNANDVLAAERALSTELARLNRLAECRWNLDDIVSWELPHWALTHRSEFDRFVADIEVDASSWNDELEAFAKLVAKVDPQCRDEATFAAIGDAVSALEKRARGFAEVGTRWGGIHQKILTAVPAGPSADQLAAMAMSKEREPFERGLDARKAIEEFNESVERCRELARETFNSLVVEETERLGTEIEAWLKRLGPGGSAVPKIVRSNRSEGNVTMKVGEGRKAMDAYANLSSSQRDMLALSVMLAEADRSKPGVPVILDDPGDLLDDETLQKFCLEGLVELASSRQTVIVTHCANTVRNVWRAFAGEYHRVEQLDLETRACADQTGCATTVLVDRTPAACVNRATSKLNGLATSVAERAEASVWVRRAIEALLHDAVRQFSDLGLVSSPDDYEKNHAAGKSKLSKLSSDARKVLHAYAEAIDSREAGSGNRIGGPPATDLEIAIDEALGWNGRRLDEGAHHDVVVPPPSRIEGACRAVTKADSCLGQVVERMRSEPILDLVKSHLQLVEAPRSS